MSDFVASLVRDGSVLRRVRGKNLVCDQGVLFVAFDAFKDMDGRQDEGAWVGLVDATGWSGFSSTQTVQSPGWTEFTAYELEDVTGAHKTTARGSHIATTDSASRGNGVQESLEYGATPAGPVQRVRFRFTGAGTIAGFFLFGDSSIAGLPARTKGNLPWAPNNGYLISVAELSLDVQVGDLLSITYFARYKIAGESY